MKYILWGCGRFANLIWEEIKKDVVLVVDNDSSLWNQKWRELDICSPDCLYDPNLKYDKIIIAAVEWKKIRKQLMEVYHIENQKIDNTFFKKRQTLLDATKNVVLNDERCEYIEYLKKNPLDVFNDDFTDKYIDYSDVEVLYDNKKSLFYVMHFGKKMYLSKSFVSEKQCARYYNWLRMEQDIDSPHRYTTDEYNIEKGNIVLDAGVAEGNFALEIIDLIEKLYLVEADESWIEALNYTFEPYKDKVQIIKGFLGNGTNNTVTIDEIIGENKIDFIKMDIEGAEREAIEGAGKTLRNKSPKLAICTYHNEDDYSLIENKLREVSYTTEPSEGYMIFINPNNYNEIEIPILVKGIIRGKKYE